MHIERTYQCAGLTYVSIKARVGNILMEKFFALSKETEGQAEYFREWLFREFLFRGMEQLSKLSPRYIEKKLADGAEKARVKIISYGTSELQLNWRRKINWLREWLKYKLRGA